MEKQAATRKGVAAVVLLTVWFTLELAFLVLAYLQLIHALGVYLCLEALLMVPASIGLVLIRSAMEQHTEAARPYSNVCGVISLGGVAAPFALYVVVRIRGG